jgi:ribosomal protein S18 acetylase RimI-like enzyme
VTTATAHRPYRDVSDVDAMKRVLATARGAAPYGTYLHVGDLDWRLHGPHGYPLSEIAHVWERDGDVIGFVLLSAAGFDFQASPVARDVEREMVVWGQEATVAWRRSEGLDLRCEVEAFADDAARVDLLTGLGYRRTEAVSIFFWRSLSVPIATNEPPPGLQIRGLQERDVESRAITQFEAFSPGSKTTPATWRHLMANARGYDPELDSVAVAPDGTVAAAAVAWLDTESRIGEFEPVATRPAYQRQGLGRAILLRGLRAMRERGMETAIVYSNATNAAAIALYESVGFVARNRFETYELILD